MNIRLVEGRLFVLVIMGATWEGTIELVAVSVGYRESTESRLEVLRDLKEQGMPRVSVMEFSDSGKPYIRSIPKQK